MAMVSPASHPHPRPPIRPVINHDFADPAVVWARGTYYAYSTMTHYGAALWHVPLARADDLTGKWTILGDAMPRLPGWVDTSSPGDGDVWAPGVSEQNDKKYLLYFTARSAAHKIQCIGAASASSPRGPFAGSGSPLVCQPQGVHVDAIDPSPFTDADGTRYLLYSSGLGRTAIWLQQLSRNGLRLVGQPRKLIDADRPDEAHVVEAPTLVHHGDHYVLFYSGSPFNSGNYFINYSTARSLTGTFVKHKGEFLNRTSLNDAYQNPGGEDVIAGHRRDVLIFHAYTTATQRSLFAVSLSWDAHDHPMLKPRDGASGRS
ncbi:MAG TPA: glycoside hydrolase family 43 protein [Pseudonocardia sp.]|uniref:glycoside hydrolase family 43 protein n=1 Tax=Pseudonocardia sp. TaxID=60912 RepID=UPI002C7EC696|nr:glycoside hydrolase family 43 protein [Pseudonocardia sp.]HTF51959.1 glycoside hydrolase family 43 protein [Pseudonocardia sp.]